MVHPDAGLAEEAAPAPNEGVVSQEATIKELARQLAGQHSVGPSSEGKPWLVEHLSEQSELFRAAYDHFSEATQGEVVLSHAAEWLLDNFYLVQRASRQVREDLPERYYRQLPVLDYGSLQGYPRIYAVATQFIQALDFRLDIGWLRRFIVVYQRVSPLTMGELWALPAMLRLALLDSLALALTRLSALGDSGIAPYQPLFPQPQMDAAEIVVRCIPALRTIATHDWEDFFETVSQVEQILRDDPAGVYPDM
ncbi:MAG: hypothetical protein ACRDIB_08540, partial [Ardenticatenaceae bacterium]